MCCAAGHVIEASWAWHIHSGGRWSRQCTRNEQVYLGHGDIDFVECRRTLYRMTPEQLAAYLVGGEDAVRAMLNG